MRHKAQSAEAKLRNIGPKSARWLAAVGIHTRDDLCKVGVINAYNLVRAQGYHVTLNLLWALQGALMDVHWTRITSATKTALLQRLKDTQ